MVVVACTTSSGLIMLAITLENPTVLIAPEMDYSRRFGGIARLYGDAALARLGVSHVYVIGIGGVGSCGRADHPD